MKKNRRSRLKTALCLALFFLAALAFLGADWMLRTWADLRMEELVYHATANLDGANGDYFRGFLLFCLLPALALTWLLAIPLFSRQGREHIRVLVRRSLSLVSLILIAVSILRVNDRLQIADFLRDMSSYSEAIDANYVSPADVNLSFPETRRNLIYIFLESMEITYADLENGGAFERNAIPELTALAQQYEDFSGSSRSLNGGISTTGTGWTAAAMFAQTSGLPMSPSLGNKIQETDGRLFPQVIALGDILERAGYRQTLLVGSSASFGGREYYFRSHGNFSIRDHPYYTANGPLPSNYAVWWGFEDSYLFRFAKEELKELAAGGQPFNLTMLTADTHFEDGYVCADCRREFGSNQYANVMACSSRQVAAFVRWIQAQDFYENTTIVLCGDHPTMDSDFCSGIASNYQRKVYTVFINSAVQPERNVYREFTTLDLFPTTLASLGVKIEGERLALGVNLFSSKATLAEYYGKGALNRNLAMRSELLENLTAYDLTKIETRPVETPPEPQSGPRPGMPFIPPVLIVEPEPTPTPTATPAPTATPRRWRPAPATPSPELTDTPESTELPEPTESPEPAESPEPTEVPGPTESPEPTASPEPTDSPGPAESPEPTSSPEPAESPEPTESPAPMEPPGGPEEPPAQESPEPTPPPEPPAPTG